MGVKKKIDSWEVNDAMHTLKRADEIRKNPTLMGEVKKSVANLSKMVSGGSVKSTGKKKK